MKKLFKYCTFFFIACAVVACGGKQDGPKNDAQEVKLDDELIALVDSFASNKDQFNLYEVSYDASGVHFTRLMEITPETENGLKGFLVTIEINDLGNFGIPFVKAIMRTETPITVKYLDVVDKKTVFHEIKLTVKDIKSHWVPTLEATEKQ